jgi:hypothetical protein
MLLLLLLRLVQLPEETAQELLTFATNCISAADGTRSQLSADGGVRVFFSFTRVLEGHCALLCCLA